MMFQNKHLLTGDEFKVDELNALLYLASEMKNEKYVPSKILKDKNIALIFDKPSLRTRFSFTAAVNQLGGHVIESVSQTRKTEIPKDFVRVLQNYCDAIIIRTYSDHFLEEMKVFANVPIINSLTDLFHPCQTLADLLTLKECFQTLEGLKICYMGDGNNVLHSLLLMATKMGITVHYCCPPRCGPATKVLKMLKKNSTEHLAIPFNKPQEAVQNCRAVYTDVWTSMGFEEKDESLFSDYQVNEELMSNAEKDAIFMHCMPMVRGKEVSEELPDKPCSVIFKQSENRLHTQKALLVSLFTST